MGCAACLIFIHFIDKLSIKGPRAQAIGLMYFCEHVWPCLMLTVLRIMGSEHGKPPWARLTIGLQASQYDSFLGRQAGRQAAPTCYMDRNKAHRIFLDRSNSFLHPSCPYWFGPFPPRCVPVALIKQQVIYPPQNESRCQENKERKERERGQRREDKTSDSHCDKRKLKKRGRKKNGRHHIRKTTLPHGQYLLVTRTYEKATAFP